MAEIFDFDYYARMNMKDAAKATQLTRGTLDTAMIKLTVDPILPYMFIKENPLLLLIPSPKAPGRSYNWNQASEGSTPSEWVAETATPTSDVGSYALQTETHKIQAGRGSVTLYAQATGEDFMDLLYEEIKLKMIGFWDQMEKQMIQGTVSSTAPGGLYSKIPESQMILNSSASGGAFFDETALMDALGLARATYESAWIVSSRRVHLQMQTVANATKQAVNTIVIEGGAIVPHYQGIPWVESTNMLDTMSFDGTATTGLTGGSCSEIYVGNKNWVIRPHLMQPTYFPLATTNALLMQFDIVGFHTFAIRNYLYTAKVSGINTTNRSS